MIYWEPDLLGHCPSSACCFAITTLARGFPVLSFKSALRSWESKSLELFPAEETLVGLGMSLSVKAFFLTASGAFAWCAIVTETCGREVERDIGDGRCGCSWWGDTFWWWRHGPEDDSGTQIYFKHSYLKNGLMDWCLKWKVVNGTSLLGMGQCLGTSYLVVMINSGNCAYPSSQGLIISLWCKHSESLLWLFWLIQDDTVDCSDPSV